jgi:hypothetical protein
MADYPNEIEVFGPFDGISIDDYPNVLPDPSSDVVPPVVDNFVPAAGSEISASETIQFDVTDNLDSFSDIWVWVNIGTNWEVIWSGEAKGEFGPLYKDGSSRSKISLGYRYTVKRSGGWPSAPTFHAIPIDSSGNRS